MVLIPVEDFISYFSIKTNLEIWIVTKKLKVSFHWMPACQGGLLTDPLT